MEELIINCKWNFDSEEGASPNPCIVQGPNVFYFRKSSLASFFFVGLVILISVSNVYWKISVELTLKITMVLSSSRSILMYFCQGSIVKR